MAELPLNGDLAFLLDKERLKIVSESENDFDKIQEILDYLMVEFPEVTTVH
jgi:coenzyme F420-reducing hydrogenase delta subunit